MDSLMTYYYVLMFLLGFFQFYSFAFISKYVDFVISANFSLFVISGFQILSLILTAIIYRYLKELNGLKYLLFPVILILSIPTQGFPLTLVLFSLFIYFAIIQIHIVELFTLASSNVNRFYLFEMLGASCGLAIWYNFSVEIGFKGFVTFAVIIHTLSVISQVLPPWNKILYTLAGVAVMLLISVPEPVFNKRDRYQILEKGKSLGQFWDPNANVEFIKLDDMIFTLFEGGDLRSNISKFDGNFSELRNRYLSSESPYTWGLDVVLPSYVLRDKISKAALISSVGGQEIIAAKAFGAKEIFAIDINKTAQKQVSQTFRDFAGNIYENVNIVNLDGRFFIKNSRTNFDLIQIYSASNATYSATLGYELLPSSLITAEAIQDYVEKLSKGGILQITQTGFLKNLKTFELALGQNSIFDDKKILSLKRSGPSFDLVSFYFKKDGWKEQEFNSIVEWLNKDKTKNWQILINPLAPDISVSDFNPNFPNQIIATTDDRPFSKLHQKIISIPQIWLLLAIIGAVSIAGLIFAKFQMREYRKVLGGSCGMGISYALGQLMNIIFFQKLVGNPALGLTIGLIAGTMVSSAVSAIYTSHWFMGYKKHLWRTDFIGIGLGVFVIAGRDFFRLGILIFLIVTMAALQSSKFNWMMETEQRSIVDLLVCNGIGMALGTCLFNLSFVFLGISKTTLLVGSCYILVFKFYRNQIRIPLQ